MSDSAIWGANFSGTSMAAYEDTLVGPFFVPWGEHLLDAVGLGAGDAVLDIACGPGTLPRLAAPRVGRSGLVVGCDLSDEMLSIARTKSVVDGAVIDYRQCSADSLSVKDDAFDITITNSRTQATTSSRSACRS